MARLLVSIFAFSVVFAAASADEIIVESGCMVHKREGANFDGAYGGFKADTEQECLRKCIDNPQCVAVDFNLQSHACAAHGPKTGVDHWQSNSCCNRYEIIKCSLEDPVSENVGIACEWGSGQNKTLQINCDAGTVIHFISASYGRHDAHTCTSRPELDLDCHAPRSLGIVRIRCEGRRTCTLKASNDEFGDPCPGTGKYLQVNYICEASSGRAVTVESGCTVHKREGANCDGAYGGFEANTEEECLQKCIDNYPQCVAVDFNLQSRACAAHGPETGVDHCQSNSCCNRYEIIKCNHRDTADIEPPDVGKCFQPKSAGPCDDFTRAYFYNFTSMRCQPFVYSGCGGNDNNFEFSEHCKADCERPLSRGRCVIEARNNTNYDGAYAWFSANTEQECVQKCIDTYPECRAVDFNLKSRACAAHRAQTGVGHWQSNSCCNRYVIHYCKDMSPQYLSDGA